MWQVFNALAVGGATVAATLGAARPAPPSSNSSLDAPGHPTVSVAIAVPATAAPRRPDAPQVSSVGDSGGGHASAALPRSTVVVANQVRRAGDGTFSYTIPRSPVFGGHSRGGHLVAFGQFPSPAYGAARPTTPAR